MDEDELFELSDMYLVIPKYTKGLYHFKLEIEKSYSYCQLSVSISQIGLFSESCKFNFFIDVRVGVL